MRYSGSGKEFTMTRRRKPQKTFVKALIMVHSDWRGDDVAARDSKTLTFDFIAGQGLMRLSVQDFTGGEYLRLTVANTQKDVDIALTGLKIYYTTRPGQFQVEGVSGGGILGAAGQN